MPKIKFTTKSNQIIKSKDIKITSPHPTIGTRNGTSFTSPMAIIAQGGQTYPERVKALFGANLIRYLPLRDASGLVAEDISGNGLNATIKNTGVTYNNPGIGDGRGALGFDGLAGNINLYSTVYRDLVNGQELTIGLWVKIAAAAWADGTYHYGLTHHADANNQIELYIGNAVNRLSFLYRAALTDELLQFSSINDPSWMPIVLTASKTNDRVRLHVNGNLVGTATGLGAWAGLLASNFCWLAANQPGNTFYMPCQAMHQITLNREATPAEVYQYSKPALDNNPHFLQFGDSRSANRGWQDQLVTGLNAATARTWKEIPLGISGSSSITWTAGSPKLIDSTLAERFGNPSAILYNVGVNDVPATIETIFKTNTLYNVDALHTRFPSALIYLARVWKAGADATCATLNGWIDYVITQRSFCRAGHDESVWAKGADNGVTMYSDGLHYSAAGKTAVAAQWKTVMGY